MSGCLRNILFTYIWKANGKLQKGMIQALERIEEGQREMVRMIERGFSTLVQMILNQTKILERIEVRNAPSS